MKTCGWCGHEDTCAPYEPGPSPHHSLCCVDRYNPSCFWRKKEEAA